MELAGKVALVTGGGTGLGKQISLDLAREGADVAINFSRSSREADETVAELKALGRKAKAYKADVSNDANVRAMVAAVAKDFGRIDVLINNAGYTIFCEFPKLDEIDEADWDRIMNVNVKGAFLVSRAAAPVMRATGGGKIVNTTSVSGIRAGGSSIPYSVSKGAETMLTKCLALALAPEITVNAIAPGLMDTRWGRLWGEEFEHIGERQPLKHIPTLVDISAAAIFLVKNDSMTGQSIVVDGGGYMH